MNNDSTLIYIVAGITALHFLVGMGYLLYKLGRSPKSKKDEGAK
ncbi:MAG: hypothetical protein ACERIH_05550 [Labilibaculum antarcticum]|nr:hypothetical protein [Labilibaculum antarcticum]